MGDFVLFLVIVTVIFLFLRTGKLKRAVLSLEKRLLDLEERGGGLPEAVVPEKKTERPAAAYHAEEKKPSVEPEQKPVRETAPEAALPAASAPTGTVAVPHEAVVTEVPQWRKNVSDAWLKVEGQLIENWTGIIGAVVMVMGVGFLGIYAALKMSPLIRFMIITAFAAFLFGLYVFLRTKGAWRQLAYWLRSSSGAIFLFACIGSGGIPGLKWIEDPLYALAFLIFGIIINLYFGFAGGTQLFASLHVVLSLVAVGIAPQNQTTMIIAAVVVLFGVLLSYRDRWERHLLVSITGYLVYHLYWFNVSGLFDADVIPLEARLTGIAATGVIGIAAALIHYRKMYRGEKFEAQPFIAHLVNWCYMAVGFFLYTTGSKWNTILLGAAALCAFLLARRARTIGIPWLHRTDTLIAQSIALISLLTLERWEVDGLYVMGIVYVEVIVFTAVMMLEKEDFLTRIGAYLHHLSALSLLSYTMDMLNFEKTASVSRSAITLAGALVPGIFLHWVLVKKHKELPDSIDIYLKKTAESRFSVGGVILPVMLTAGFYCIHRYIWTPAAAAAVMLALLYLRARIQSNGLGAGLVIAAAGMHLFCWQFIGAEQGVPVADKALYALPFLAVSLAGIRAARVEATGKHYKWIGIYLFTAHLALSAYYVLNPVSPFLPGVVWILLSPLYLETALYLRKKYGATLDESGGTDSCLLNAGVILVVMFLARHVLVHMQSELYLGPLKVRLVLELLGIAVMFYWALARRPEMVKQLKLWTRVHPLFWEGVVALSIFTIALEVPVMWHPPAWIAAALVLLFAGDTWKTVLSRFRLYALMIFWLAAFHIAFLSSTQAGPSQYWLDQEWVGGLAGILVQIMFVIYFHHRGGLASVTFPFDAPRFARLIAAVGRRVNLWVYYPFFTAIALFLYWSFDSAILTLLWVAEAFSIFVLSVILKENHFRYLSMAALIGCLLRLVGYDLARTATITRALVFLGVGGLMLAMNYLYGRYKERF
jgi:hypothetical protein